MIRSDHHFVIGRSHDICQDYAASLDGFAALSDGCSSVIGPDGKPFNAHTDIGARLLVRAAFHHQRETDPDLLARLAVSTADGYRRQLGLPFDCLSGTLMCLQDLRNTNLCGMYVSGDGVVAARGRDTKLWDVCVFTYENDGKSSPPYYPRYGNERGPSSRRVLDNLFIHGTLSNGRKLKFNGHYGLVMHGNFIPWKEVDCVVAMSDGAMSFTRHNFSVELYPELSDRLLDFKRMKGRFVLRNFRGILSELAEDGYVHQDDISMIALYDDGT